MEIIRDIEQGSPEWFSHRLGSIGGSSIASVVAGGKGKTRSALLYRLAGEILSGEKYEGYTNHHMERGLELEAEARALYEFQTDNTVEQVALVKMSDHIHYSPDGLIDPDGLLEIKCTIPSVHVETIYTDKIDGKYIKQMQWGMFVCKRKWCDFVSYSPSVKAKPIFIKRVKFDSDMASELWAGAQNFIDEMEQIIKRVDA